MKDMRDGTDRYIEITLGDQRLTLWAGGKALFSTRISTGANGPGEALNSECTPRGWHIIRAKIGAGCRPNSVFVARRPTGELYTPELRRQHPGRDWILTRILWLSGMEPGFNRLGDVDTMRRYVYIHGSPDDVTMGVPDSRGCIRMHNDDVIRLFDLVEAGTRVLIREGEQQ